MSTAGKAALIAFHAFVGWVLCGAVIFVGRGLASMEATLIAHAILAPVFFAAVTRVYTRYLAFTEPLTTAVLFTGFVLFMDIFVVALLIEKSFAMFRSPLGTWIPLLLIFAATWTTAALGERKRKSWKIRV